MILCRILFLLLFAPCFLQAQNKNLDYFITQGLSSSPAIMENNALQQNFQIQNEIIAAQNTKPQVSFTADYLFAPFFFDNGKPISITNNPSPKAYGYDVGVTNGGLYSAQFNVTLPIYNTTYVKSLYQQNRLAAKVSAYSRKQIEQDIKKNIIEQYILAYQFQVQGVYLQKIIDQLESRKPMIAALIKQGLLQQSDYLLLDIQILTSKNELKQLEFAYKNGIGILRSLTSITDTTLFTLEKPGIITNPPPNEYYYEQKFQLDSLNILAQQNVFDAKYKPQVNLIGSTGINATEFTNIPHNIGLSAGVHVAIPLYDGKQQKLNERQNKILISNLQAYRNNAAKQQQNNLRNAKLQIVQWKETIDLLNLQLHKQEVLIEILKEKVISGQVTVMEYVKALEDYAIAQKNKTIAETNILLYTNQYNYYNW